MRISIVHMPLNRHSNLLSVYKQQQKETNLVEELLCSSTRHRRRYVDGKEEKKKNCASTFPFEIDDSMIIFYGLNKNWPNII